MQGNILGQNNSNSNSNLGINGIIEEQVIGTWIDGKPIYRKVMSLQSSTAGEHLISFSDLNADFITIEDFYIKSGNFVFSYNRYNSATDLIEVFINQGTSNIVINVGNSWANFRAYIIIEYTKTTD